MADGVRELVIKFLGDTKDLIAKSDAATSSLDKWKKTAVLAAGAVGTAFAATKVVDFLQDSTKAAEEDKKSQAILAQQIKDTTHATDAQVASVEKFIDKQARATGVMDDQLRPAYAALLRGTKDTTEAQKELALAQDIAAARGIDLGTVTNALEKAHNGNIGALGRLGIAYKDVNGNALTLQDTLTGAEATYAGAAAAAVTPSERMSVAFQELKEQVGTALLPILEKLTTFLANTLLPAIQNAVAWVETNWPRISATIKKDIDVVVGYVTPIIQTLTELWQKYGDDLTSIAKGAWDTVAGTVRTAIATIQLVVQPIVDLLHGDWGKAWDDFSRRAKEAWDGIVQTLKGAFEALSGIFDAIVKAAGDAVIAIIKSFASMPGKIYDSLPGPIQGALKAAGWATGVTPITKLVGHIPGLASGGIVSSPTLAMIGESGPEAVVPLSRGGGMGSTFNIATLTVVANDPRQLVQQLQAIDRTYGGVPINVRTPA